MFEKGVEREKEKIIVVRHIYLYICSKKKTFIFKSFYHICISDRQKGNTPGIRTDDGAQQGQVLKTSEHRKKTVPVMGK